MPIPFSKNETVMVVGATGLLGSKVSLTDVAAFAVASLETQGNMIDIRQQVKHFCIRLTTVEENVTKLVVPQKAEAVNI